MEMPDKVNDIRGVEEALAVSGGGARFGRWLLPAMWRAIRDALHQDRELRAEMAPSERRCESSFDTEGSISRP